MLYHVHRQGQLSRAELTSLMSLNRSTIAGLVTELEAVGAAIQTDPSPRRHGAGRPSPEVRVNADGPYVVAVDVGVGRMIAARVGLGGLVHARVTQTLPEEPEPEMVARDLAGLVRHLVVGAPPARSWSRSGSASPA